MALRQDDDIFLQPVMRLLLLNTPEAQDLVFFLIKLFFLLPLGWEKGEEGGRPPTSIVNSPPASSAPAGGGAAAAPAPPPPPMHIPGPSMGR